MFRLTANTLERRQWQRSGDVVLVFLFIFFTSFFGDSIVDFKQVNVRWEC